MNCITEDLRLAKTVLVTNESLALWKASSQGKIGFAFDEFDELKFKLQNSLTLLSLTKLIRN